MPIFEFKCAKCGHQFERICKTDQATSTCPECGVAATRVVSVTASRSVPAGSCGAPSGFT